MTVKEILQGAGAWSVGLSQDIPRDVLDSLGYFGHIIILAGRLDPTQYGDNLLTQARYVGVLRERDLGDDYQISGASMATWLGDEDGKGSVYETPKVFTDDSFTATVRALLPASGAITEGTLHPVAGGYTGQHQFEDPRTAITYVCGVFTSDEDNPVEWKTNGNGTLDAGHVSDLYQYDPVCIVASTSSGYDLHLTALGGSFTMQRDVEDFTTRVVLLAEGEGSSIATGDADINPVRNPYRDIHGNTVALTRLVSESDTATGNADARAQLQLNRFTSTRDALTLSASDFDIKGTFQVGDYIWAYDPDSGLVDSTNEIEFRGQRINPAAIRVSETEWPITEGFTVAFRTVDGDIIDLTDYVRWEPAGSTSITVGGISRTLTDTGTEPVGSRPNQDTSIPGVPAFVTPFDGSTYLDGQGLAKARVIVAWTAPLNVDGTVIADGDHYELRYRSAEGFLHPETWDAVSTTTWDDLRTWDSPLTVQPDNWQPLFTAWGQTSAVIQELAVNHLYEVQIRAVDRANNIGEWSTAEEFLATADDIPPSTPAPPSVAASRIAAQITHDLGKASGGTFNLERDLHHLEVHVGPNDSYTPSTGTLVGKALASASMIQAQTPVVATFQIEDVTTCWVRVIAVDTSGNTSDPSEAAPVTALLIDDAHISDLTVSKVTAGTISSNWIVGASIRTAPSGARVELNVDGLQAYNNTGLRTVDVSSATGNAIVTGKLQTGVTGQRIIINPAEGEFGPEIRLHPDNSNNYSYLLANTDSGNQYLRIDSGVKTLLGVDESARITAAIDTGAELQYRQDGNPRGRVVADRDKAALRRNDAIAWVDETGFYVRNGTGNVAFVRKVSDLGRTSTTPTADDELFVELEGNACYTLEALIVYSATSTADITITWGVPSGAEGSYSCFGPGRAFTSATDSGYAFRAEWLDIQDSIAMGGVGGTTMTLQIKGLINTDADGRLSLMWSQAASDSGTPTFVRKHSFIRCVRNI